MARTKGDPDPVPNKKAVPKKAAPKQKDDGRDRSRSRPRMPVVQARDPDAPSPDAVPPCGLAWRCPPLVGCEAEGWGPISLQRWWDRRQAKELFGNDGSVVDLELELPSDPPMLPIDPPFVCLPSSCSGRVPAALVVSDAAHHDAQQRHRMKAETTSKAKAETTSKATPKAAPKATSKAVPKATSKAKSAPKSTSKAVTSPKETVASSRRKFMVHAQTQTEGIVINNKLEFFEHTPFACKFGADAETQTDGIVINNKEPQTPLCMRHGCLRELGSYGASSAD